MSVFSSCGVSDKPLSEALVPGKRQHQTKLLGVLTSPGAGLVPSEAPRWAVNSLR